MAIAQAHEGNLFGRTWRRVTGGRLDQDLPARATYSRPAVSQLITRIREVVDRPPRDAKIGFSATSIAPVPSQDGLAVRVAELRRQVDHAIVDPFAEHKLVAHTRHVEPKVTTAKLAKEYGTLVIVDRGDFQLRLYEKLKLARTYPIAVGMVGLETPAGLYHVQNKAVNPAWTKPYSSWVPKDEQGDVVPGGAPGNPLRARWLGIYAGAGIHGIDPSQYGTIGHAASHGCIRMRIPDVEALYDKVPVGAPIYIA